MLYREINSVRSKNNINHRIKNCGKNLDLWMWKLSLELAQMIKLLISLPVDKTSTVQRTISES
jgi:hypothetical protein